MASSPSIQADKVTALQKYTACDVSDALLRLGVPGAGFLSDLEPCSPNGSSSDAAITIAPASTVLFAPKGGELDASWPAKNIPSDANWSDMTEPGTIAILRQPDGQKNAVCGGIMALRMSIRGVKGIVAVGRVRDVDELRSTGLPIWSRGRSTVGVGAGSVPWAVQVPLEVDGAMINPGDLAFCDPANGVVVIPQDKVDEVLELLPRLVAADERVKEAVVGGMSVHQAFQTHRGKI
ncbi:related to dlpA protein [Cephalotrichum gorgonifer]|uniref:Related to dlpA protein n=1 Tax=Cephalotrichum gorgonifer TaxID=2041049 RepID=A0AAE8SYE8_9PEZI|nr:related to dlpA protein [Cephalotrichum gorgonifer]